MKFKGDMFCHGVPGILHAVFYAGRVVDERWFVNGFAYGLNLAFEVYDSNVVAILVWLIALAWLQGCNMGLQRSKVTGFPSE